MWRAAGIHRSIEASYLAGPDASCRFLARHGLMRPSIALIFILMFLACAKENAVTSNTAAPPPAAETQTTASAPPAAAEAVGTGACALVTLSEVGSLMGHQMKFKEAANPSECVLVSAADDPTKSVSFQVFPGTDTYAAMAGGQGQEVVSGIGEKALIGTTTNMVVAVKGGRTYLGGVFDSSAAATVRNKSIELAKKAVARM